LAARSLSISDMVVSFLAAPGRRANRIG
jgi:hypothetical protein